MEWPDKTKKQYDSSMTWIWGGDVDGELFLNEDDESLIWYVLQYAINELNGVEDPDIQLEHLEPKDITDFLARWREVNELVEEEQRLHMKGQLK
tara:strand:+ start:1748 stop:2029 length:282 start_codon:yes stop_codon:yes gene_type:complete